MPTPKGYTLHAIIQRTKNIMVKGTELNITVHIFRQEKHFEKWFLAPLKTFENKKCEMFSISFNHFEGLPSKKPPKKVMDINKKF